MVALRTELGHGRVYRAAPGEVALFAVTADGDLRVASPGKSPPMKAGDRVIALVGAG
ncbi:MAG TPA: hypothetical protein VFY32_01950 [Solirubrobacteraceae bacterium]|nr:hypothetical protein [Solirubrobacteraceae bacterium]